MPIRNMGTLLENIVLTEAMRLVAQGNEGNSPIDFLNSFVMPPLSVWHPRTLDRGFESVHLETLRTNKQPAQINSYQGMLWACLQQPSERPGSQGPNGALLVAILAHHLGCPIRMWLNDIRYGDYGNASSRLEKINAVVQQVLGLPRAPQNTVVTCEVDWPHSLALPASKNLTETLAVWGTDAHARLGFLDPMQYQKHRAESNKTNSTGHQRWLKILSNGFPRLIISVHFTANRNRLPRDLSLEDMHQDGLAQGYQRTFMAGHRHYRVVCNIKHPNGEEAALTLVTQLQETVQAAWDNWFRVIGRNPYRLTRDWM
jgi:hypothetical protein